MRKKFAKLGLMMMCVAISGLTYSQEAVLLKYNFVNGKNYVQNSQVTQNVVQSMGGQEIKVVAEVKSDIAYSVEKVDAEGNATIMVSASDISIRTSMPGRDTTLTYGDMKDKSRVVYSVTGKTLSSEKVDSSDVSAIVSQIDFGKLKILPGKLVKTGEKWQDTTSETKKASSGSPFTVDTQSDFAYTLVRKESKEGKEYYKIAYSANLAVTGKGNQMGMDMFIEGTGKVEGFMYFDPSISMIAFSEDNTEMNMNIAVSGQQNMTIPMTQNIKVVTKFEEKK